MTVINLTSSLLGDRAPEIIARHRRGRKKTPTQDGRKLRGVIVEDGRLSACLRGFNTSADCRLDTKTMWGMSLVWSILDAPEYYLGFCEMCSNDRLADMRRTLQREAPNDGTQEYSKGPVGYC